MKPRGVNFRRKRDLLQRGDFLELGAVQQAGGKVVMAWAFEGDCDPGKLVSNRCEIEWPPRSGRKIEIPEVDRGDWFSIAEARAAHFEKPSALSGSALQDAELCGVVCGFLLGFHFRLG